MELSIRPMTEAEKMYCYSQSSQIRCQTGNIGYLRADMDSNGQGFFSTWNGFQDDLKTEAFKQEFDEVINKLRSGETPDAFLHNRTVLGKYCWSHPEAVINSDRNEFGFRVDTDEYSYMMRLNPNKGEYNLYCYCYRKDWLNDHMKEAERGIRFIDIHYNNLFRLKDGGVIRITWANGEQENRVCRYIDSTHLEVGHGPLSIYHICELAETIARGKGKIEPVVGLLQERDVRRREGVR